MEDDLHYRMVLRPGSGNHDIERIHMLQKKAEVSLKILREAYKMDPNFLRFYVPKDDEDFQHRIGGTRSKPVLLGMFRSNGRPIYVPPDRTLQKSRAFSDLVIPLFTSETRAKHFWASLRESGCVIPECSLGTLPFEQYILDGNKKGDNVINPIPELVLTAYQIIEVPEDEDGPINFILVVQKDEEEREPKSLSSFFQKRK